MSKAKRLADHNEGHGDLRFVGGLNVSTRGETIFIENAVTGAGKAFPKDVLPVLNKFMEWTNTEELVLQAFDENETNPPLARTIEVFEDLLHLGVLETRRMDLTGARYSPPGAGWGAAMRFLGETRTTRETVYAVPADFNAALALKSVALCRQPSAFYERVGAPFRPLPPHQTERRGDPSFVDAMMKRRTARRYSEKSLTETELSTLLKFAWGMTSSVPNPLGDVFIRKTSPSGGSLHPIEIYPIVCRVKDVPSGCYHYSVRRHGLEQVVLEDPTNWIAEACGDQAWVAEAAVIFLLTGFLPRTAWKYGYSRVARAVLSEIGFSSQSAMLTASWLGLGAFTTAALRDQIFEEKFGLDPSREPVFAVVGAGHLEPGREDHSRPRTEDSAGVESA